MTKSELLSAVSHKTGLSKAKVDEVLQSIQESIRTEVKDGGKITLHGFGTFSHKTTSARKGINPATKAPIDIPAKETVKFKASDSFME